MNASASSSILQGFTLIELLVVIAIVAVLAAILFPVFAQAKTAAKKSVDVSNMKQVATALHLYLQDDDDVMPYQQEAEVSYYAEVVYPLSFDPQGRPVPQNHLRSLLPYLKNRDVLKGPGSTPATSANPDDALVPTKTGDTNLIGNQVVLSTAEKTRGMAIFDDTANLIYNQEFRRRYNSAVLRPLCSYQADLVVYCYDWHSRSDSGVETYSNVFGSSGKNDGGAAFFFLDGHARYRAGSSLKAKEFGLANYDTSTPSEDTWASQPYGTTLYRPIY